MEIAEVEPEVVVVLEAELLKGEDDEDLEGLEVDVAEEDVAWRLCLRAPSRASTATKARKRVTIA